MDIENLRVEEITQVFNFERELKIREFAFDIEKKLTAFFSHSQVQIENIHDMADPNLDRVLLSSKNERFSASQVRFQHSLDLTSGVDLQTLKTLQSKRRKMIVGLMSDLKLKHEFNAYIIRYFLKADQNDEVISTLQTVSANPLLKKSPVEFQSYYALKYKSDYFLNVTFGKVQRIIQEFDLDIKSGKQTLKNQNNHIGLELKIDVNTKLYEQNGGEDKETKIFELEEVFFNLLAKNRFINFINAEIV